MRSFIVVLVLLIPTAIQAQHTQTDVGPLKQSIDTGAPPLITAFGDADAQFQAGTGEADDLAIRLANFENNPPVGFTPAQVQFVVGMPFTPSGYITLLDQAAQDLNLAQQYKTDLSRCWVFGDQCYDDGEYNEAWDYYILAGWDCGGLQQETAASLDRIHAARQAIQSLSDQLASIGY